MPLHVVIRRLIDRGELSLETDPELLTDVLSSLVFYRASSQADYSTGLTASASLELVSGIVVVVRCTVGLSVTTAEADG